jgi:hypothetical protein
MRARRALIPFTTLALLKVFPTLFEARYRLAQPYVHTGQLTEGVNILHAAGGLSASALDEFQKTGETVFDRLPRCWLSFRNLAMG